MVRVIAVLVGLLATGASWVSPATVEAQGPGMVSCPDGSYSSGAICPTIDLDLNFNFNGNVDLSFTGSPTTISSGPPAGSATLTWSSTGAIYCESSDFAVPYDSYTVDGNTYTIGKTNGSVSVSPTATKTYSLTCRGIGENAIDTKSVTITVTGAAVEPTTPTTPTNNPTANGFSSIFEIDNDTDHAAVYATVPVQMVDLASGASTPISATYAFPYAGTWHARACGDQPPYPNGSVVESSESNCTSWQTFLITDPGIPNLVAGSVYAGGAVTSGVATILYSNTNNTGTGATGASSVTVFQRADDVAGTNAITIGSYTVGDIAAAGQQQASTTYSFPSAATWYMRSCVDWNGQIPESDEGNCGTWEAMEVLAPRPVCDNDIDDDGDGATDYPADSGCSGPEDVSDAPNKPTVTLSANPTTISTIAPNNISTLTWDSTGTGVTSCTAGGTGFSVGTVDGSDTVSPATAGNHIYTIYCTNSSGNSPTVNTTVTVISPSTFIMAQPASVDARGAGGSTNLLWSAADATICDIDRSQGSPAKVIDDVVPNGTTTTAVSGITRQTRFTITCATVAGSTVTSFVTVNPLPISTEF